MVAPVVLAALANALGGLGSAAISSRRQDAPTSKDSLLDWRFDSHSAGRPGYTVGNKHYEYETSHFQKIPSYIPPKDIIRDDNGNILGWFRNTSNDPDSQTSTSSGSGTSTSNPFPNEATDSTSDIAGDSVLGGSGGGDGSPSGIFGGPSYTPPSGLPQSGQSEWDAKEYARTHPYLMNPGTEGEMFLGQRENVFSSRSGFFSS